MKRIEVFISGAGIAGLTLGCLLGQVGIPTVIADPALPLKPKPSAHGTRTAAILSSLLPLYQKQLGIWEDISSYSAPLEALKLIDCPSSQFTTPLEKTFYASEINQEAFSWNMPNNILLHSLHQKAKQIKDLTLLAGDQIEHCDITATHVCLHTSNGQSYKASLLVGADGRHSKVREIAHISVTHKEYEQTALTAILSHSKPHHNISTEYHKAGGPFTLVPLPHQRSSLVWIEHKDDADLIVRLTKEDITDKIQAFSENILGEISLESEIQSFPLSLLHSKEIIAPRIVLIAEAAHILPPTGAQGLNLSLRDVQSLSDILKKSWLEGCDLGALASLSTYKKSRTNDIDLCTMSTHLLNHFIKHNTSLHHVARRSLFSLLSETPMRQKIMEKGFQSQI